MRWTTASVGAGWLLAIAGLVGVPLAHPDALSPFWQIGIIAVLIIVSLALASVVAVRAPGHPASALLAAGSVVLMLTFVAGDYAPAWVSGAWVLLYLPFAELLLLLPDGRFANRVWRGVGIALLAVSVVLGVGSGLDDAGLLSPAAQLPGTIVLLAFFGLLVVVLVGVGWRYRHSGERERLQLRWMLVAGLSLPITLLLCWTGYLLFGTPDLVACGVMLIYLAIPAGATVAIVRPTWFDVDRATVATLTATSLSVLVLGSLSVACALTGLTLLSWSPVWGIVATIVLTLLVVVLYRPIRRTFDRMLYPERQRATAALDRLRADVDAGRAEPESVQDALRDALRDPGLLVAYRRLSDGQLTAIDGMPVVPTPASAPVRLRGEEIGFLVPSPDRAKPPARATADAAAPLVDNVRLRAELAYAMAEVSASRERILRAGYEERRRLERDLHDSAQQRLVALGMRLRVLQRTAQESGELVASLDGAVAELGTAVAELRQIAHGMRPSALDDGLGAALADLARLSPAIRLDVHSGPLPDAIGTTAYYVASEAVANAVRYADASTISIRVRRDTDSVRIVVIDDGCGGAVMRPSAGLAGLQDRVGAIGGALTVHSEPGSGTTVEAVLPCES